MDDGPETPVPPAMDGPAIDQVASDAHSIAMELHQMNENANRSRTLGFALFGSTVINLLLVVLVVFILIPVLQTAHTVERVAGPKAIAKQSAEGAKTIGNLLAFVVCTTRENTSEARVMNGQPPLPLRRGCPAYNFSPDAPLLPPTAAKVPDSPKRATTTTHATTTTTTVTAPVP